MKSGALIEKRYDEVTASRECALCVPGTTASCSTSWNCWAQVCSPVARIMPAPSQESWLPSFLLLTESFGAGCAQRRGHKVKIGGGRAALLYETSTFHILLLFKASSGPSTLGDPGPLWSTG